MKGSCNLLYGIGACVSYLGMISLAGTSIYICTEIYGGEINELKAYTFIAMFISSIVTVLLGEAGRGIAHIEKNTRGWVALVEPVLAVFESSRWHISGY